MLSKLLNQRLLTLCLAMPCHVFAASAFDHCYQASAKRYGLSADLLRAIAVVESSENPSAVNGSHAARTGSRDLGLMQINSRHLGQLSRYGISERDLFKPCTAVDVGAWLLSDLVTRHGSTWQAVGAYNAACTQLKGNDCTLARMRYVNKVQRALSRLASQRPSASPTNTNLVAMRFDIQGGNDASNSNVER